MQQQAHGAEEGAGHLRGKRRGKAGRKQVRLRPLHPDHRTQPAEEEQDGAPEHPTRALTQPEEAEKAADGRERCGAH